MTSSPESLLAKASTARTKRRSPWSRDSQAGRCLGPLACSTGLYDLASACSRPHCCGQQGLRLSCTETSAHLSEDCLAYDISPFTFDFSWSMSYMSAVAYHCCAFDALPVTKKHGLMHDAASRYSVLHDDCSIPSLRSQPTGLCFN